MVPRTPATGALSVWRIRLRNGLALTAAALVLAALAALFILPGIYPPRVPLGDLSGQVLSYEVTVTKLGGTRGTFAVRLDRGDVVKVDAREGLVPGMQVCVRAVQHGFRVEGYLVADTNCPAR